MVRGLGIRQTRLSSSGRVRRRAWQRLQLARSVLGTFLTCMSVAVALAEDVKIEHAGLESRARFENAGKDLGEAVVVLLIHDTLDHAGSEPIAGLQSALKEAGVPTLSPTLSRGINARRGAFDCKLEHDHRAAEVVDEIGTWVAWLKGRGATRVALLGHAYGSVVAVETAAVNPEQLVRAVVLLSPPVLPWSEQVAAYKLAGGGDLAGLVAAAKKLVEDGEEESVVDAPVFLGCRHARVSVTTLLEHYGQEVSERIVEGTEKLPLPVLVMPVGGHENVHLASRFSGPGKPANIEFIPLSGTALAPGQAGAAAAGFIKAFLGRL